MVSREPGRTCEVQVNKQQMHKVMLKQAKVLAETLSVVFMFAMEQLNDILPEKALMKNVLEDLLPSKAQLRGVVAIQELASKSRSHSTKSPREV